MTETTRMQELIEIFCDADRRRGLTAEEIERYCRTRRAARSVLQNALQLTRSTGTRWTRSGGGESSNKNRRKRIVAEARGCV